MLLPSILEYSIESLQSKILLLNSNTGFVNKLQKNNDFSLHLDFVMPEFAKSRSVMTSLGLEAVMTQLVTSYRSKRLSLSMHLMGETEDLLEAYNFFKDFEFMPKWNYLILVPEKYKKVWINEIKNNQKNVKIGDWYDLNEWQSVDFSESGTSLLMTVQAGKSGQVLEDETKALSKSIVQKFNQHRFIVDGGWVIKSNLSGNTDVVSYSDFWTKLENNV
jgi:pentose-5-phosphate-3-epimerase